MAEIKHTAPTQDAMKIVLDVFEQIGTDMNAIKELLSEQVSSGKYDHIDSAVEVLASRSGALADSVLKSFNQVYVVGTFEEWLR
ncbi:MAG: hypothetical protein H6R10_3286 [Rhodocyclaceae bacterium]|nr:hypothetical protein [Rhodocyclaceae bacterium]